MFAKNSDFVRLANSAASRAIVFLCMLSLRLDTILLIFRFNSSISPEALTVINLSKLPSVAASVISPKARTCDVKFSAIVLLALISMVLAMRLV